MVGEPPLAAIGKLVQLDPDPRAGHRCLAIRGRRDRLELRGGGSLLGPPAAFVVPHVRELPGRVAGVDTNRYAVPTDFHAVTAHPEALRRRTCYAIALRCITYPDFLPSQGKC